MKKQEAEQGIRFLCTRWARAEGITADRYETAHFEDFWRWLKTNHSEYLTFKSRMGVLYDVEMWFEEEMNQSAWR